MVTALPPSQVSPPLPSPRAYLPTPRFRAAPSQEGAGGRCAQPLQAHRARNGGAAPPVAAGGAGGAAGRGGRQRQRGTRQGDVSAGGAGDAGAVGRPARLSLNMATGRGGRAGGRALSRPMPFSPRVHRAGSCVSSSRGLHATSPKHTRRRPTRAQPFATPPPLQGMPPELLHQFGLAALARNPIERVRGCPCLRLVGSSQCGGTNSLTGAG